MDGDDIFSTSSSLESVGSDPYGDDEHDRMDLAINQELDRHNKRLSSMAVFILPAVIAHDKQLDQDKYGDNTNNVMELFKKYPVLVSKVEDARRKGSYRDIRKLAILQAPSQDSPSISGIQLDALEDGLNTIYRGEAVGAFQYYLQKNDAAFGASQKHKYYGRFCSIVQSSGTGKTRLMLQLAKKGVRVLYMNIQSPGDTTGYPHRDTIPANILTKHCDTEAQYSIQYSAFFAAIFKTLRKYLEKQLDWDNDMCKMGSSIRALFFEDLAKEYANVTTEIQSSSEGKKFTNKYYRELVGSKCFPATEQNQPGVVIALDEAHTLYEMQHSENFLPAKVLLRTINVYSAATKEMASASIWVVFASTTSKVAHFASPQTQFPSARVATGGQLLFPPFTQLGWDQYAPVLKEIPPDEVAKAKHIFRYGRPLWGVLMRYYTFDEIIDLAEEKLCGSGAFTPATNEHQAFAVLAQRFGLDIAFGCREAVSYIETSIASHLRVCIKTTEDRTWSYTTYPSEPILSCIAASLLHGQGGLDPALQCLQRMVNDGIVDIGQTGELVSRFLWLLAKDFFVRDKVGTSDRAAEKGTSSSEFGLEQELQDCQLVPVVEFLEFVFGEGIWQGAQQGRAAYQNAYINFSHWVSMDANIKRSNENLVQLSIEDWTLRHWERTSAAQCCHNQPRIDKVIPMYFKGGRNEQGGISQLFISDKARIKAQGSTLSTIRRDHSSIAPGYRGLPYIAVLADLGVETPSLNVSYGEEEEGKCLRIHAVGLNETTYPFLKHRAQITCILKDLYRRQSPPPGGEGPLKALEDQVPLREVITVIMRG